MKRNRKTRAESLGRKDFRLLIKTCEHSDNPVVNKFLILMPRVYGLRIGEMAHMKKTWVDFESMVKDRDIAVEVLNSMVILER